MKPGLFFLLLLFTLAPANLAAQFRFRDSSGTSLVLLDGDAPVFVYNYGVILKKGVRPDRARCCYFSPVYAPNGVILTADFPKDELHHRGMFWAWPVVRVNGKSYDLWHLSGIQVRAGKIDQQRITNGQATLAFTNRWFVGDRPVVAEKVEVITHKAQDDRRDFDFTLELTALVDRVELAGAPEDRKGYGGFGIRFARTSEPKLTTPDQEDAPDGDSIRAPWAQFSGTFEGGKRAGVRITIDSTNPGFPNIWDLRHYGFLGVDYPGLERVRLPRGKPLILKYRVTLAR